MRQVAILGVAMTKFGVLEKTNLEMFAEAGLEAIALSNLEPKDMEALYFGNCLGDFEEGQMHMAPFAHAELGLPVGVPATRFESACATATVAIRHAALLVGSGVYDVVLAGGTERACAMGTPLATRTFAMGHHAQHESTAGLTFPGVFAMAAHIYSEKYKVPLKELKRNMAEVAVKNHFHGAMNPKAHFQKEIDVDTVLDGMMVADPLQLFDCCPFSDGAAAVVVAEAGKARDLVKKPVYIGGMGQASAGPLYLQKDLSRVMAREASIAQAYRESGLGPDDVDVVELHDCFTIAEILALESFGLYEFGKAYDAAAKRETYLGGRVVVNPSGGLKAKGHPIGATGAAQVTEIVEQLRGESGPRQVEGARVGLVDTLGGDFGTICNIVLRN
ncbi:MAG: propanoyl-CoA acyltransferase [Deltaproteobacteria bacterium]|nr:propanoyl-CoA acyltransferase [Deltaproteobacteria bacterium]MBW2047031.1 propanoyl-CoA acyltransferase [Deltaproteobacteria bacterium]MBW2110065.1 propanoyl-CoA acyltransferase [Deltaproteobacteria bacterium]MBW2351659.1 propanoyl-CoA acyltransferase [Deltaproteobacteria bacterium]HDZ89479.1 propanoyl-CoA acyltransferase [Deltaproteobacteria bacterium]